MKDHLKEREIIDVAKKNFAGCLQKQVSGASFFDGGPEVRIGGPTGRISSLGPEGAGPGCHPIAASALKTSAL
jgi:hypothetical protein